MNEPANKRPWRVDPGDELRDDLKPVVDFDYSNTLVQRFVHVGLTRKNLLMWVWSFVIRENVQAFTVFKKY